MEEEAQFRQDGGGQELPPERFRSPVIVDNNGVALKSSTRSCHEHVGAGLGWVGSRLTVPEGLGDEDVRLGSL